MSEAARPAYRSFVRGAYVICAPTIKEVYHPSISYELPKGFGGVSLSYELPKIFGGKPTGSDGKGNFWNPKKVLGSTGEGGPKEP